MSELWDCAVNGHVCFINTRFKNKDVEHLDFNQFKKRSALGHVLMVTDGINDDSEYLYIKFKDDTQTYYMKNRDFPSDDINQYMRANNLYPFHLGSQNDVSTGVKVGGTIGLVVLHLIL